jgi:hypothetical protein
MHILQTVTTLLRMLRMFKPKEEVTGGWIKIHEEELHNFRSSPNIIRVVKSRMWHVTGMGEKCIQNFSCRI